MKRNELEFPIIYENGIAIGYGGNQDWFSSTWKQRSGCGATCGANMAAYYASTGGKMTALYKGEIKNGSVFNRQEFIELMENMFSRMTPGAMGYPYPGRLARRFVEFSGEHGIDLTSQALCTWNSWQEAYRFVQSGIDEGHPIALLVLFHRAAEMKEDLWHWVTIGGYEEDETGEKNVIVSNCGDRDILNAKMLFESHRKNVIRLIRFHKKTPFGHI